MTQEAFVYDVFEPAAEEQPSTTSGVGDTVLGHDLILSVVGPGAGGGAAPVIDNFAPAVGTPITRDKIISFDVTDDTGLLRAEVFVTLGGDTYVVHDGERFRGSFTNYSSRAVIANGFRYNVKPNGGWTSSPTFEVHAVDTSGQEAT